MCISRPRSVRSTFVYILAYLTGRGAHDFAHCIAEEGEDAEVLGLLGEEEVEEGESSLYHGGGGEKGGAGRTKLQSYD